MFDPAARFIGTADLGTDRLHILRLVGDKLEPVSEAQVAKGMGPHHVAFAHNGNAMYAIDELDGRIVVLSYDAPNDSVGQFSIDASTGALTPTGQLTPVLAPNAMVFREAK